MLPRGYYAGIYAKEACEILNKVQYCYFCKKKIEPEQGVIGIYKKRDFLFFFQSTCHHVFHNRCYPLFQKDCQHINREYIEFVDSPLGGQRTWSCKDCPYECKVNV